MKKSIYFFTRAGQCCCSEDFQAKIQYWLNASNQRIQLKNLPSSLIAIKNELTVEKKNLSAIKNLRTCAPDQRPSAAVAGYLGAFIISLVLSLIILMDCSKLMTNLRFCQLSSKWDLFNLRENNKRFFSYVYTIVSSNWKLKHKISIKNNPRLVQNSKKVAYTRYNITTKYQIG